MLDENELICQISDSLKLLGISPKRNGYYYLRYAIFKCYYDPSLIHKITKELYPSIAKRYNKTDYSVEKAIRVAIEEGWNNSDYEYSETLFRNTIKYNKDKPTNGEFIATVTDELITRNKSLYKND